MMEPESGEKGKMQQRRGCLCMLSALAAVVKPFVLRCGERILLLERGEQ